MAAPKLTDEARMFIVQSLAMYDTPTEVSDAVKDQYGVSITRQTVQDYDPTIGKKPAKKWIAVFESTRARFLEASTDIPIANRSVRLRRLQRMAFSAESKKNYVLAAQLHEQAAKECGDYYTNTRKLSHSGAIGGGVLAVPVPITDEQWGAAASAHQAALAQRPGVTAPRVEA